MIKIYQSLVALSLLFYFGFMVADEVLVDMLPEAMRVYAQSGSDSEDTSPWADPSFYFESIVSVLFIVSFFGLFFFKRWALFAFIAIHVYDILSSLIFPVPIVQNGISVILFDLYSMTSGAVVGSLFSFSIRSEFGFER